MKILYIGDNSDSLNWGCRATSIALRQLIGSRGDVTGSVQSDAIARNWPISDRIGDRPYAALAGILGRGKVRRLPGLGRLAGAILGGLGTASAITHDLDANIAVLERARAYHPGMRAVFDRIEACDIAVVNGEGDLIFGTPARQRLLFILTLCHLIKRRGKRLYYLNAMASGDPGSRLNGETIALARNVLAQADALSLRDPMSFEFAAAHLDGAPGRMSMHPDAVFSWAPLFAGSTRRYEPAALLPFFERTGHRLPDALGRPYIVLGGSSRSARDPVRAVQSYGNLVRALAKTGVPVVLAPACTGDLFLKAVARETGTTMLPLDMPVLACAAVVANARAYVSGRWHPSIMAALGGTPCIFLESNSHKTLALQHMLDCAGPHEFPAWPERHDIDRIADRLRGILATDPSQREEIQARAAQLGQASRRVTALIA